MFGSNNGGFNYQPFQNKRYVVLKKADVYVAMEDRFNNITNGWGPEQYQDFISQGFVFWWEVLAINSNEAIKIAKEYESQEINRLKAEINKLKQASASHDRFSDVNPLVILGFSEHQKPSNEELKKKKNSLARALHPDREGSDFLMKLVNNAYDKLKP